MLNIATATNFYLDLRFDKKLKHLPTNKKVARLRKYLNNNYEELDGKSRRRIKNEIERYKKGELK